jgi:transcriptional regulator with XRE-family HTH domain
VDDVPGGEDLLLASVTTREELTALLRTVRVRADNPSLRALESRTRHDSPPLSKTSLAEMLKGERFPRKAFMVAFLRACGVQDHHIEPWRRAWERVAINESGSAGLEITKVAPVSEAQTFTVSAGTFEVAEIHEQIKRLSEENNRLRLQLAGIDRQQPEQRPHVTDLANAGEAHSPEASRRELGIRLGKLRSDKGLTAQQVAEHLMCKAAKVRRMEAGFRAGTLRDVRDLCDLYGVTSEAERSRIMKLAEGGKQPGWWQSYELTYDKYVGLEEDAVVISGFQSSVIHGLLQTADYARAGHEGAMPRLRPNQIEKQIEAKLTRQRILTRDNPPRLTVVLDEAALCRMVGGRQVMAVQLNKILEMSAWPNIVVQVLAFEHGAHPALESNFTILELPNQTPGIVYVEGLIGATYLEQAKDLKGYNNIFNELQSIALSPADTADLIAELGRSYRTA